MAEFEYVETFQTLTPRQRESHKGTYGTVLVVGGSRGMTGATSLAVNAALRGGAGLVRFAAPEPVQLTIAGLCPCATSRPLRCNGAGDLTPDSVAEMRDEAEQADVLAVGPGMRIGEGQQRLVAAALEQSKPVVLDADGLNNLARMDGWPARRNAPMVLTPHPGEFARLTGKGIKEIQADRENSAVEAAQAWRGRGGDRPPLIVVLKGRGTVVTDGWRVYVNDTGNPGMASGGTGDVLTGLVAALWAQGLEPFDAACLGVYTHGLAGDYAADELGEVSLIATDLLDFLPDALREMEE